jgi:hypothetical protein
VFIAVVVALAACSFRSANPATTGDARGQDSSPPGDGANDATVDTTIDSGDPCPACMAAGGTCAGNVCTITTGDTARVVSPAGMECHVNCSIGDDACKMGVDCTAATKCVVFCTGMNACVDAAVLCNADTNSCNVTCTGDNACRNGGIVCGGGPCQGTCIGANACQSGGVICGAGTCSAQCVGNAACENGSCPVTPASCTRNCCGAQSCQNGTCAPDDCEITHSCASATVQ